MTVAIRNEDIQAIRLIIETDLFQRPNSQKLSSFFSTLSSELSNKLLESYSSVGDEAEEKRTFVHSVGKKLLSTSHIQKKNLRGPFLSLLLLSSIGSGDEELILTLIRDPDYLYKLQRTTHEDLLNYLDSRLKGISWDFDDMIESFNAKLPRELQDYVSNRLPMNLESHEFKILVNLLLKHTPEESRSEILKIITKRTASHPRPGQRSSPGNIAEGRHQLRLPASRVHI
jgi:hypothetical protein